MWRHAKRLPPQRELSCAFTRMTEDKPHAATSTYLQESAPTFQAEQIPQKRTTQTLACSSAREREGGGFSQRSRLPRISPHISYPQENFLEMLDRSTGFVYNIICLKQKRARFSPCDLRCWADGKKVFV